MQQSMLSIDFASNSEIKQKRYSSNQASRANSQRVSSASNMDSGASPKGRDFIGKYSQDVSAWVEQLEDLCTPQKKRIRYD
eukprot:403352643